MSVAIDERAETRAPTFSNLLQVIEKIDHLRHLLVQEALDRADLSGVTSVQGYIVARIEDSDRVPAGDFYRRGLYLGSNVSYNLNKLIEANLLTKFQDKDDKRVFRVSITSAGKEVRRVVRATERQLADRLAKVMGQPLDLPAFHRNLNELENFLSHELRYRVEK